MKHSPTKAMIAAAKRGVEMAQTGGADDLALAAGTKMASGVKLSDDHVRSMAAFHGSHPGDCPSDADDMLWGGMAGASWSAARVAAMDSKNDQSRSLSEVLADDDKSAMLEIFTQANLGEPVKLDESDDGLIWAPILRSGTLATRPGPNGEKLNQPLVFVAGHATDPTKEIGLQNLVDAFNERAVEYVTIPKSHDNTLDENTGFIDQLKIVDSKKVAGEKLLVAGHRFTESDAKGKVQRGTYPSRSCGILYDHVNTGTAKRYAQVLEHVALTHKPWVTGMAPYGSSDFSEHERVPMMLSESRVTPQKPDVPVFDGLRFDRANALSTKDSEDALRKELALADVQWDDSTSLNSIRSKVYRALQSMRKMGGEDNSYGAPYYSVLDCTTDKALIEVDYGSGYDDNDAWVAPFTVGDDGSLVLSQYSEWTPVEQAWITDDDADQDKKELAAILGENLSEEQLEADMRLSESQLNLAPLTTAARKKLPDTAFVFPKDKRYPIADECLVADTRIALLDGRVVAIADLVGCEEWIYSYDTDRRAIVPAIATNVRLTQRSVPVLRIVLDTGEIVRCTGNHPFLLRDGTYRRADELADGDSLMPLYRKVVKQRSSKKHGKSGKAYQQTWQPFYGFWDWTHRLVARESFGRAIKDGHVVHHDNDDPFDNRPGNLIEMTRSAHCALEGERAGWSHLPALRAGSIKRWAQDGARERQAETMRAENERRRAEGLMGAIGEKIGNSKLRILPVEEMYERYVAGASFTQLGSEYGCSPRTVRARFERAGLPLKRKMSAEPYNHSVVEVIQDGVADVYDLEVPDLHNFGLACGIFVHNSHAKNALARSSGKPEEATVKAAVYKKFPQLKPKSNMSELPDDPLKRASARRAQDARSIQASPGGNMKLSEDQIRALGLSAEATEMLTSVLSENQRLQQETEKTRREARTATVKARVTTLSEGPLKVFPGFLRIVEETMLADDGDVAIKLTLSDGMGGTTSAPQTATQLAERFIQALVGTQEAAEKVGEQGRQMLSDGLRPDVEPPKEKPVGETTGDDMLAWMEKAAPGLTKELLSDDNRPKPSTEKVA